MRHVGVLPLDLLGYEAGQQRVQQERVPSGELAAGVLERGRRVTLEHASDKFSARRTAKRRGSDDGHARLCGEAGGKCLVLRRPGARLANREHERNREAFQAAHQMSDEAKRRLIRPVQVVDRQEYGRSLRDADCQPIQAVQHGERVFLDLVLARR